MRHRCVYERQEFLLCLDLIIQKPTRYVDDLDYDFLGFVRCDLFNFNLDELKFSGSF